MDIRIENFQSIAKADLTCTGLTVVVGPSNRGKSALLRAIQGALFNRPGDQFVRVGAKNAEVEIVNAPTSDHAQTTVRWTKGTVNRYTIDGAVFSKVGTDAPQQLQDKGYRDIWVGDAARKKGESIRPQVGTQFEPLYLLPPTPGSFLADVLGMLGSRQDIVTTAQDRCASDLRSTKQTLGVRTRDRDVLLEHQRVFEALPVTLLSPALVEQVQRQTDILARVHRLLEARARLQTLVTVDVPTAHVTAGLVDALERQFAGVQAWHRRAMFTVLTRTALPSETAIAAVMRTAHELGGRRRRTLLLTVLTDLPPQHTAHTLDPVWERVRTIGAVVNKQAAMVAQRRETDAALRMSEVNLEEAIGNYEARLSMLPVCKTCGQPILSG